MIAIIDYDAGNLRSVEKAFEFLGEEVIVTRKKEEILSADGVVLPGVGAFKDAMDKLTGYGLIPVIKEAISSKKPFLGICLGMQLMYEKSEEGNAEGLKILKGCVKKFPETPEFKVPQIGWNCLEVKKDSCLLKGVGENPYVYFVHSYYVDAKDKETVTAQIPYSKTADVLVEYENIMLTQFHPEKSGETGLCMLKNFADFVKGAK